MSETVLNGKYCETIKSREIVKDDDGKQFKRLFYARHFSHFEMK